MIFDSDVLIWFLRREPSAMELIDSTPERSVSVVTLMEGLQGAKSGADMRMLHSLFRETGFRILPLTEVIGNKATGLIEEHALPDGLRVIDALIAATAIDAGEVLATSNVRHFRTIRSLEVRAFHPRRK
jgi:predicted nucleic acid-binding protein